MSTTTAIKSKTSKKVAKSIKGSKTTKAATTTSTNPKKPTGKKSKKDGKDRSKIAFAGKQYGKGRLVQAVIEKYVADHPHITSKQLEEAFPTSLHSLGLFQTIPVAKKKSKGHRRFFTKEPIKLKDKTIAVCSEFGTGNIDPFLEQASKQGYPIKKRFNTKQAPTAAKPTAKVAH